VSVCIAAYNHEKYIADTIGSVLDQGVDGMEIIITDDCSSDQTFAVASAIDDRRIRVFRHSHNQGPSITANDSINKAQGNYICLLASDDIFLPGKIRKQLSILENNPKVGATFSLLTYIDEEGRPFDRQNSIPLLPENPSKEQLLRAFFFEGNQLAAPTAMVRRHVFDQIGLCDPRLVQTQDFDLWIRLCLRYDIHIIQEPLVGYRIRSGMANLDANTPAKIGRVYWELSKALERFCALNDADLFFRVFPEALKHNKKGLTLRTCLALVALNASQRWTRAFGLELLYREIKDPRVYSALEAAGFGFPDFSASASAVDVFGAAALADVMAARDWWHSQAQNWENAHKTLASASAQELSECQRDLELARTAAVGLNSELEARAQAADRHAEQARNWRIAAEARAETADWHAEQARNWRATAEALQASHNQQTFHVAVETSNNPARPREAAPELLVERDLASAGGIVVLLPFLVEGALSLNVLRALRAKGADVAVVSCVEGGGGYIPDDAADFAAENRLIHLSSIPQNLRKERLIRELERRGTRLVLQIGAFAVYPELPYVKEQLPGLRVVDILYNEVGHTLNHFLYESCFDGVIVESQQMASFVRHSTLKSDPLVRVVESGVDLNLFSPGQRRPVEGPLRIGYVGRLSPEKNPLGFIELFDRLAERLPRLKAIVAGEGPMGEEVRTRIAASPAAARLTYLGRVPAVTDALHAIDVLVVPSTLDGRPNIVMEANACGVPVIGAPVGGIPELIEEGVNGYLAAPSETDRIASWLRVWDEDPSLLAAIGLTSRKIAEARFDRRRMIADYAAAFAHFARS